MFIDLAKLAALVANILGGISILAVVVFAFTAWLKQLGLKGKKLTIGAFVSGVVLALLIRVALLPPKTFAEWVFTVLFGLMSGLMATGAYKGGKNIAGAEPPAVVLSVTEKTVMPAERE